MVIALCAMTLLLAPQSPDLADEFVSIVDVPQPADVSLEVGGLLPRGDELFVSTRRGEIWRLQHATSAAPEYSLWAEGLQEPLGLLEHDGWIWVAQRGELSRMRDSDGDGRMDQLETVCSSWELSGNYHEYCFGPALAPDGSMWLTLNKPFGDEPFGHVDWRGWAVRITPDGKFEPVCAGLRSPAGIATSPGGEIFYTDNQGEWCATGKLTLLQVGDFHGHPHGIDSCRRPESLVPYPGDVPDGLLMDEAAKAMPAYRLPAVWIPYDRVGRSPAGFVWDTAGNFGPYRGQIFVGDQYSAEVFRISLEKVEGRWQGACYPFRRGLKCGITRVAWDADGSLWCGMTNRGWSSLGTASEGLQRLVWNGRTPFDLLEVTARRDGFRLRFTTPVDPATIEPDAFAVRNWTYRHHSTYGSPEIDPRPLEVRAATIGDDTRTVDLQIDGLVPTRVHMIEARGVRAAGGAKPWHGVAYYTLEVQPAS
ncbi:MAG: hypothetical protein IPM29_09180 [Planctomycetes bacterium]|nr:hypothetical protein [Planctomycetota bacterium]